ncbi:TIGR04211 family SH3 domain-containing protein [Ectothiorhodospiraceae bacterium BW-2]|nr:TIGR04211 family SH3 domain-containing protein [Ectothiorhodospiraceae bacterium BW-2]
MTRQFPTPIFALLLTLMLLPAPALVAETHYITDQIEVTLRSGESTRNKILRMLPSGTAVEVLSQNSDSGYSRVRINGREGYILTRQLQREPSARSQLQSMRERIEELQASPNKLQSRLAELQGDYAQLQQQHQQLQQQHRQATDELQRIEQTAANAVRIERERQQLQQQVDQLSSNREQLLQQNSQLQKQSQQRWFLIGAGVLVGGILLGLILPHLRLRRRSSWDRL